MISISTLREHVEHDHAILGYCVRHAHRTIDLAALIAAGYGDVPLDAMVRRNSGSTSAVSPVSFVESAASRCRSYARRPRRVRSSGSEISSNHRVGYVPLRDIESALRRTAKTSGADIRGLGRAGVATKPTALGSHAAATATRRSVGGVAGEYRQDPARAIAQSR